MVGVIGGNRLARRASSLVITRRPLVYEELVALTGIEPDGSQFSSVQLGLSVCKHVQLVSPAGSGMRHEGATLSLGCHSEPAVGGKHGA